MSFVSYLSRHFHCLLCLYLVFLNIVPQNHVCGFRGFPFLFTKLRIQSHVLKQTLHVQILSLLMPKVYWAYGATNHKHVD